MASSGGDNVKEKPAGDATHVAANEAMSKKINMKKIAQMAKGKGEPKGATPAAPTRSKAMSSRVASKAVAPVAVPREATLANSRVDLGPIASVLENPKGEKLLQRLILPTDQEVIEKLDLNRAITRRWRTLISSNEEEKKDELDNNLSPQ
ncbi:hypothetical protein Acr_15g0010150 [Actinidia rufa]|uniref:Uncharacterized protein n=1 Tax=Actinidia rufa TaxID=165716 RepID=A0A7J0FVD2_9ERIC|nr:hypothetical protein Acr_15g0010150 [Actinidia rufa]